MRMARTARRGNKRRRVAAGPLYSGSRRRQQSLCLRTLQSRIFRCLRSVKAPLRPLTMLDQARNDSGKSAFLAARKAIWQKPVPLKHQAIVGDTMERLEPTFRQCSRR